MSSHLRGRVRFSGQRAFGERVWLIEVVNTATGKVVHSDNTCDLSRCCDAARDNATVARAAWTMGLRHADLKTGQRVKF